MSFVLGARSVVAPRHLDAMLNAYADRSLPAATLLACDQHVAICPGCRNAADAERRLLSSLRTAATPAPSSRLESALLGMALSSEPTSPTRRPPSLAVVARSAPAMHRSPVRAALLASLAAGASAAAAWSVGVSGVEPSAATLPVVRFPSAAAVTDASGVDATSSQPASYLSINRAVATAVPVAGPWPGVRQQPALGTIDP